MKDVKEDGAERHLWEFGHDYYASEGCFYSGGKHETHRSWADFVALVGADVACENLLYRWDWIFPTEGGGAGPPGQDPYYRDGVLSLFYVQTRKAYTFSFDVSVCQADEPAVRAWLEKRWTYVADLWAPVSGEKVIT